MARRLVLQGFFHREAFRPRAPSASRPLDVGRGRSLASAPALPGMGRPLGVAQPAAAGGARATRLLPDQLRVIGPGRPLPVPARAPLEAIFEADLSTVRVHEGPAAGALGALAFTLGEDLHFAPGRFDPGSRQGLALLGHELTHVLQQRAGLAVNPYGDGVAIVQDPALEAQADAVGRAIGERFAPGLGRAAGRLAPLRRPGPSGRPGAGGGGGAVQPAWLRNLFGGGGGGGGGNPFGALAGLGQHLQNQPPPPPVWVAWNQLFRDPGGLLGNADLVPSQRFPSPVHAQQVGTARIPTVNVYQCTHNNRRPVRLRQDVNGHALEVRAGAGADSRWAFFLPWSANTAHQVQLNQMVDVFMTDPLNGCGILITGLAQSPTVIHANYYLGVEDLPMWRHFYSNAYLHTYLNQQRENEYNALALHLGLVNPYLYSPRVYYAVGRARVFGLRDPIYGRWRFFATDLTAGQKTTYQIWP